MKDLFEGYGPLSTLSGKCRIAYALGAINEKSYRKVQLVRKIRSLFAHESGPIAFNDPRVRPLQFELTHEVRKGFENLPEPLRERLFFNLALTQEIARIEVHEELIEKVAHGAPFLAFSHLLERYGDKLRRSTMRRARSLMQHGSMRPGKSPPQFRLPRKKGAYRRVRNTLGRV